VLEALNSITVDVLCVDGRFTHSITDSVLFTLFDILLVIASLVCSLICGRCYHMNHFVGAVIYS